MSDIILLSVTKIVFLENQRVIQRKILSYHTFLILQHTFDS